MAGEKLSGDEPSPAATILLLRDDPAFEVLMILRHENSAFAGGALVFPGGRIDPGDCDQQWRSHARGLGDDPRMAAAQIGAIREAFEEAGVLLARDERGDPISSGMVRDLNSWRKNIERDGRLFLDLVSSMGLTLACDQLRLFSHWIAPPGLHRRFDTIFFAARFPRGQQVLEDGNEATESLWIAPQSALDARNSGDRKIIFPTACNLGLLGMSLSVDGTFDHAARREILPVTPAVIERGGRSFLQIPDGLGYPVTEERLDLTLRR